MEQIDSIFDNRNIFKKQLNKQKKKFHIRQGKIWFISFGQNISYEIYGKSKEFLRQVLVFRKINQNSFDRNCIKQFEAKIAYQSFYNLWKKNAIVNRGILYPYFFIDKRFIIIYILSFFGLTIFDKVLNFLGKNV